MEVERKFLVRKLPPEVRKARHARIQQGYLCVSRQGQEVRIRKVDQACFLTLKMGDGLARKEVEIGLDADQFARLWPLTRTRRLVKDRYKVPHQNLTIEVDVYSARHKGLLIAEVEFPNRRAAESFQPPTWFAREVTGVSKFKNQNLAG